LDWTFAASSGSQEADQGSWQREPLTIPQEQVADFAAVVNPHEYPQP